MIQNKRLGSVWISSAYPVITIGLTEVLEEEAEIYSGIEPDDQGTFDFVVLCLDELSTEDVPARVARIRGLVVDTPVLVFGMNLDLSAAQSALQAGAMGFIHAGMEPGQIVRAFLVVLEGEVAAPRQLLEYMLTGGDRTKLAALSSRQREILEFVASGFSNAQIAQRLYLSESTVKQHLRTAYKLLDVRNRTEAAKLFREI